MKLSEAVLLGSTLVKLDPTIYLSNGCGCLLGMAAAAMGKKWSLSEDIYVLFPWLMYYPAVKLNIELTLAPAISRGEVTIEQAVDYIRSVEPQDEAVEANAVTELSEVSQ
jgi:hypothetical protein